MSPLECEVWIHIMNGQMWPDGVQKNTILTIQGGCDPFPLDL